MSAGDLSGFSMLDLFRTEVEGIAGEAAEQIERARAAGSFDPGELPEVIRAGHSLKGAARLVGVRPAEDLAHALEERLAALREGPSLELDPDLADAMLACIEQIQKIARLDDEEVMAPAENLLDDVARAVQQLSVDSSPSAEKPSTRPSSGPTAAEPAPATAARPSMMELFRAEVESLHAVLTGGLLELEQDSASAPRALTNLMRAAHSLKGAARLVGVATAEKLTHAMEDYFVAVRERRVPPPGGGEVDLLLRNVDLIGRLAKLDDVTILNPGPALQNETQEALAGLLAISAGEPAQTRTRPPGPEVAIPTQEPPSAAQEMTAVPTTSRTLRLSAQSLDSLMGLAGEVQVAHRWLSEYTSSLLKLRRQQADMATYVSRLTEKLKGLIRRSPTLEAGLREIRSLGGRLEENLAERLENLDDYNRRLYGLSQRLQQEVVAVRMRPFSDIVQGFPRMVRDLARSLGKQARLDIEGLDTPVDRDILERVDSPLNHLLRNAVAHGIETPEERVTAGKPGRGLVRLEAFHRGGMLVLVVRDDGCGIDLDELRETVVERKLVAADVAPRLSTRELTDFLFLPNFSTGRKVDVVSGRGVGLDVVHSVVTELGGQVHVHSDKGHGQGAVFELVLPITLSVVRCLLAEISKEPYAFPLARVDRVLTLPKSEVQLLEGKPHIQVDEELVGLVPARRILALDGSPPDGTSLLHAVIVCDRKDRFALQVDRLLGEQPLVAQPLDPRLGATQHVSSGAILEDRAPVLILDVDDLVVTCSKATAGELVAGTALGADAGAGRKKRVLVVDDSITVREIERQILELHGYAVDVAVDGVDGWTAVRNRQYDLIVSDVDMPRMDGFQLVSQIKSDPTTRSIPTIIVSYKDREEDRLRGLNAGADYYMTKGSFHDESFLTAVQNLIGGSLE